VVAAEALTRLGVPDLSIDLNLPTLVPTIFAAYGVTGEEERRLAHALGHRDRAVAGAASNLGPLLADLLDLAGPADAAIEKFARIMLPPAAEPSRTRLVDAVRLIRTASPDLMLTVDPLERQGFEYQTGLSFTIFARGSRRELGRGGRYRIGGDGAGATAAEPGRGEPATGFSLFADAILNATPEAVRPRRVYLPFGTPPAQASALRAEDWITVSALAEIPDADADARRLGCSHILGRDANRPRPLLP
jgi:ATP phosphoribosyltransferase regulatory subunit